VDTVLVDGKIEGVTV